MALAARRLAAARAAAAPHARVDRGPAGRAVGGRRDAVHAVRSRRIWDALAQARRVHGGADDLRQAVEAPTRGRPRRGRSGRRRRAACGSAPAARRRCRRRRCEAFRRATGQTILERYGMTEIGMALSNPYDGPRVPGAVGSEPCRASPSTSSTRPGAPGRRASRVSRRALAADVLGVPRRRRRDRRLIRRGPGGSARATPARATRMAYVRLLGRTSIDIIKSGGDKLSALEIEAVLLEHPAVAEAAVTGVPDDDLGERVTAWVVARGPGIRRRCPSCRRSRASAWLLTNCRARWELVRGAAPQRHGEGAEAAPGAHRLKTRGTGR